MTAEQFQTETDVSRETLDRLALYLDLLTRWQSRINLVGSATLGDPWRRHMLDSAQLLPLCPEGACSLIDLGTGAGFPGLVLAIMGVPEVHLVESDARKCAFLREAARVTATVATIHPVRVETLKPWAVDVVTARALAPLPKLLGLAAPFLQHVGSEGLFLKGKGVEGELTDARKQWTMTLDVRASRSDPSGAVLRISEVARVRGR
ncbi:MAG: 16S rRNA (guanine(527)-N(7))-methyltransferase RsmG [Alphaproteobacteria bacterium]